MVAANALTLVDLPREQGQPLEELVAPGRIVELCGPAQTTAAVLLLAQLQREGETAAWIQPTRSDLFPPDLAAAGVDLDALIVVHIPEQDQVAGQCRAAELLLRSGAFGLLILDFGQAEPRGSTAWQGRLLGLARQHDARVVILRERDHAADSHSLGPLTGLRIGSRVERNRRNDDPLGFESRTSCFTLHHEVLKNKSGGLLAPSPTQIRGPWGFV